MIGWLTNEMLLYGGIAIAAITALAALLYFCFSQIYKVRLQAKLDEEYGKKIENRGDGIWRR
ncbi:MAG: hypothetical protein Q4D90_04895 [bacterium]|nr:hypothetical protein [bacterium]